MRTAVVESVCECQAQLGAELDEQRRSVRGWARKRGRADHAPAITTGLSAESFNVGWACPFCGRNTLRSFDTNALVYQEKAAPPAAQSLPPASRPAVRSTAPSNS
jgi:hypothetical protein